MSNSNLKLSVLFGVLLAAAFIPNGNGQTGTQTTVLASPAGPIFTVDGFPYHSYSAFWPVGSQHVLTVPQGVGYSYDLAGDTQWQFESWQWANGSSSSPTIQVVGNVGSTLFTAEFTTSYLFTLQVACNPAPCSANPGTVLLNGGAASPGSIWVGPGTTESLAVITSPGYIFSGWQVTGNPLVPYQVDSVTVNGPTTVVATFIPSKPVTLATIPANLDVYADGTEIQTPQAMLWAPGSSHSISGLDVALDTSGNRWVWASWSDGGAQSHTYVVGNNMYPETVTATYAAAVYPLLKTSPAYLAMVIDGIVAPPPYGYIWGVGSTHTISATSPQTDARGNVWIFQSWSDGVTTPSRTITMPLNSNTAGYQLTANFTQQATLNVNSTIAGQVVTVNGKPCTTPCNNTYAAGTQVQVSAPATVAINGTSRQDFVGWSTGVGGPVPGVWTATLNSTSTTITADYQVMNLLSTASNPSTGGTLRFTPSSPDGYYSAGTQVNIGVAPSRGYRFGGWSGDLSGADPRASLNMNVPHTVTAQFNTVPAIGRGGVRNGAGVGTAAGVAPGSVASIYGEALSAQSAVAPANAPASSLAGVTVSLGTRTLPLFFASPEQINFLVPPDLATGPQTLTVNTAGMPDATADFEVVRNAPGVFPAVIDGQTYAMAMHEDGTPVTSASPAKAAELLTLYGTGFGPTDHPRPDSGAVPAAPSYRLLDPVTVQVGAGTYKPEAAIAAPGQAGVDLIRFRLDSSAPSGAAVAISVTVNGVSSNILSLPIE